MFIKIILLIKNKFIKIDVQGDEKNIFHSMSFLLNQNTSFEIEISHNYNFTIGDVKILSVIDTIQFLLEKNFINQLKKIFFNSINL